MSLRGWVVWGRLALYALVIAISVVIIEFMSYFEYLNRWNIVNSYILPLAVAILSLLVLVPAIVLEVIRFRPITSQPRFELIWVGILMALWLSSALFLTIELSRNFAPCSRFSGYVFDRNNRSVESWCGMHYAGVGLLWTGWALLVLAMCAIITFSVVHSKQRQGDVWNTPLADFKPRDAETSAAFRRTNRRRPTTETQEEDPEYQPPTREQQQAVEAQIAAYRQGFFQATPPRSNGGSQQHASGSSFGNATPRAGGVPFPSSVGTDAQRSQVSLQHPITGQRSQLSLLQPAADQRSQQSLPQQPVIPQRSQQSLRQGGATFDLASPPPTIQTFKPMTPPSLPSHQHSREGTPVKTT